MEIKFLDRNIFQRIFGIPATAKTQNSDCWRYEAGKLSIDLNKTPELAEPGGALRLEGGNLPERVLVIRDGDGNFRAIHNRCTHLGHRRLDPVPGTDTVQCCSVGKSTYGLDGTRLYGPAPATIRVYPVRVEGDLVVVEFE
jgi:nitrite reductase/ring-hydroxylating ferredoxin subunit